MELKVTGEGMEPFNIDIKEINLDIRTELNIHLYKFFNSKDGMFPHAVSIIKATTNMTKEEINVYSNEQIINIAMSISNYANKKKAMK